MTHSLTVIRKRRAVRKYQDRPVAKEKIEVILRSALFAPSARHTRGFELVVVTDKEKIEKLGAMKLHASHVKQAAAVMVFCSQDWQYWLEDASIVAEHIWLEAVHQGLASCWTQVRNSQADDGSDPEEYVRKILGIPEDIRVLCLMPLGFADESLPPHDEKEIEKEKIHFNRW
jgi:nitroreductase